MATQQPTTPLVRGMLGLLVVLSGCGPAVGQEQPAPASTEGEALPPSGGSGEETGGEGTAPSPPPSDVGHAAPTCGDGLRERGEDCDDANLRPGDGCEADCMHTPGTLLWELTAPAGFGFGLRQAIDSDGNIFVTAAHRNGAQDMRWTAQLDPEGIVRWETTEPIGNFIASRGIVPTPGGGLVITSEVRVEPETDEDHVVYRYFWAMFDGSGEEVARIQEPTVHRSFSPPPIISDGAGGYFTAYRTHPDEDLFVEHWSGFGEVQSSALVRPPRDEPIAAYGLGLLEDGRLLMVGLERDTQSADGGACSADGWGKSDRYAAVIDTEGTIHDDVVLDEPGPCIEYLSTVHRFAGGWLAPGLGSFSTFDEAGAFVKEQGSPAVDGVGSFSLYTLAVDGQGRLILAGGDTHTAWTGQAAALAVYDTDGTSRFAVVMEGHDAVGSEWGGTSISAVGVTPDDDLIVSGYRTTPGGLEHERFIQRYAN